MAEREMHEELHGEGVSTFTATRLVVGVLIALYEAFPRRGGESHLCRIRDQVYKIGLSNCANLQHPDSSN